MENTLWGNCTELLSKKRDWNLRKMEKEQYIQAKTICRSAFPALLAKGDAGSDFCKAEHDAGIRHHCIGPAFLGSPL